MPIRSRVLPIAALLVLTGACGSKTFTPPTPTGPTGPGPAITCGSTITVSTTGPSKAVTFPPPIVTDGTEPVTTTCTPASGAAFALGTTAVNCVATDAFARQAACTFNVVVNGIQFPIKKFSAIGDSLTAGENGQPLIRPTIVDTPNSYPTKLQALFDGSFPNQGITIVNHGFPGRMSGDTLNDLPGYLAEDRPEVVLLLTGYNDLLGTCSTGYTSEAACDATVNSVSLNIRDCIRHSKEFSTVRYVFVSLITPSRPGSKAIDPTRIVDMNAHITNVAAAEGAIVVDNYANFIGHETAYISDDGLHLLPPGYQAMADAFFAKILATIPTSGALFLR